LASRWLQGKGLERAYAYIDAAQRRTELSAQRLRAEARRGLLPEFSALDPGPTEQLAMLLLGHALAPLLDY
jgi:hypothetical protein